MSKTPNSHQEHLFPPDEVVIPVAPEDLNEQQTDEYDRLDDQAFMNPAQMRQKVGAIAIEPRTESWTEESNLRDSKGNPLIYEYAHPPTPARGTPLPSRSRKGMSPGELRIADSPPVGYDGR